MTFTTTDQNHYLRTNYSQAVREAMAAFKNLPVDDQLGLLWVMHQNLGCSLTPSVPGAARLFLTQGLLHRVKQMSPAEQSQVIQDLVRGADTPIARQYGLFVPKTKLAFWSQIFEWMFTGEMAPVSVAYQLSSVASRLLKDMAALTLDEQVAIVRQVLVDMGVEPLAA
jgi:hypothetical protein